MRVQVLQHAPFEGLGCIQFWLDQRGAEINYTRCFAGDAVPTRTDFDFLIAMGGPMSVNDEADLPWLKDEKRLIRDAIAGDIPVLGICLGAQLIASALGARVYRNRWKEIGWFPISAVEPSESWFGPTAESTVFHWHGETFDLPEGAKLLARNLACQNQAFQLKESVFGLQFHLEVTPESALAMIENSRNELVPERYVQSEAELLEIPASRYEAANLLMCDVLACLVDGRRELKSALAGIVTTDYTEVHREEVSEPLQT